MKNIDVLIIGAGAAGLVCAIESGKRGRSSMVIDHANKAGKKILMSGGGRCNFTNLNVRPECYSSHNPHFCKSALSRYTAYDFIALVKKHRIPFHEKTLGQLFCNRKSQDIVDMLLEECAQVKVNIYLNTSVIAITRIADKHFKISSTQGDIYCSSLVIASGGLSIPTMGASPFAYRLAEQFGLRVWPTRAGLVPLTLHNEDKQRLAPLSGISADSLIENERMSFRERLLFTHRGLSGPAILQMSSYWQPGEILKIRLLPDIDLASYLKSAQQEKGQQQLKTVLAEQLPKRLIEAFVNADLLTKKLIQLSTRDCDEVTALFQAWLLKPNGTEGYRTAEVTLGGVDCDALSSKTLEVTQIPGLYFIGEALDVTGWLGGYNFQWAWSSGWAAGQVA